ncbi:hypothetical protein [Paracoccus alkanivorans]|uniref:hypothetical protein n=1 Tax=Paracoccus alkanivorans TaxID=2116655 RepID=UPI001AA06683|nr:hypothetical protein [Paracoccus alkanivorans]
MTASIPISTELAMESCSVVSCISHRYLNSSFGFQLFCEAHDGSPAGTLPIDDRLLARADGVPVEKWRDLCARPISPLHNWHKVRCDNGAIRLAHDVVTQVAKG